MSKTINHKILEIRTNFALDDESGAWCLCDRRGWVCVCAASRRAVHEFRTLGWWRESGDLCVCVCVCWQQSSLRLSQSVRTSCCNNTTQHTLPTPGKSPNNAPHRRRRSLQLKAIINFLTTAVLFDWHCCWEREASQWSYADIAILSDSLKEMCVSVFKICLGHILIYIYSYEKKTNIFWWINFIIFLL